MRIAVCEYCGRSYRRPVGGPNDLCSHECKFWAKVDKSGDCWEWTAARHHSRGYGQFYFEGQMRQAHRIAYQWMVGPIPDGLQIDHLCRNRGCVNPDHLEPVTARENWIRGNAPSAVTYRTGVCQRGHSMENPVRTVNGNYKTCRTCFNENAKRRYWEKKEATR